MVRSLWSAASGMIAQQNNVDTIANNLANVNTTGYKTEANEFKSLLYQTLQTKTTTANGEQKPIGAQVGLGVRNASITSLFHQGPFLAYESNYAFAINGKGFFGVRCEDGNTYYTRNGDFNIAVGVDGMTLCDFDGNPVLDTEGEPIVFEDWIITSRLSVSQDGQFMYPDEDNNPQPIGIQIGLFQFLNPSGLDKVGDSMYAETEASGEVINEADNDDVEKSEVRQGYLEGSNVQVADEMVNLIVAQRAYEMNSKAIQASDEMLQQANQLRR
ncbi:flagellar hook-basal body protein [bacterium C-53]|nr:flagellar hook-basal body protein [Lachnospiraceae bacterium]NBI01652.1 flagellar hook-basal body protein [Lachnospiraceae bacterium]RKJ12946.1 flagellar hook-basal body protein [bacterium C-53]